MIRTGLPKDEADALSVDLLDFFTKGNVLTDGVGRGTWRGREPLRRSSLASWWAPRANRNYASTRSSDKAGLSSRATGAGLKLRSRMGKAS